MARTATTQTETTETTDAPVQTDPAAPTVVDAPTAKARFDADTLTRIKGATPWKKPKDGETITGTIVHIMKRTGAFGPYPCVILNTGAENGKFTAVHAFHGVLLNELKEMKAKPGDDITILYTGKRTANRLNADGSEKQYHGYSVVPTDGAEVDVFDFS